MILNVYIKDKCPQCIPVKVYLKSKQIKHQLINIDHDEQAYNYVKGLGFKATPVLMLEDGHNVHKTSVGMQAARDIADWFKEGLLDTQ